MSTNPNLLNNTRNYRHSFKGLLTNAYHKQIERSKKHGWPLPSYSLKEFQERWLVDRKFLSLFIEWTASGYIKAKKPSIDRIDPMKPYTAENIQVLTWAENRAKGDAEGIITRATSVTQYDLSGNFLYYYPSVTEAVKRTGCNSGLIIAVCQGKRNHTGGYKWHYGEKHRCKNQSIYENPELLNDRD